MTVETKTEVGTPAVKPEPRGAARDAVVVTPANFNEYVDKKLAKPEEVVADDPNDVEGNAKKELAEIEKVKAAAKAKADADAEEIDHPEPSKKERLNSRFSELTQARKDAEAKAAREAKVAAEERTAREEAQRERDELRAKYEPPKSDELGPEPTPEQFANPTEYGKALKDWTADSTRREDARTAAAANAKVEGEKLAKQWGERVKATQERLPDYQEKLDAASHIKISDQAREAIVRSDVGPEILYHLANNQEVAENLGKLTVGEMYFALGKIAAEVGGTLKKAAGTATATTSVAKVEISKAPPPISPLNGGGAAVVRLKGSDEWHGSYEEFKRKREKGQIT